MTPGEKAYGPHPWQQHHWDARAAGNFMGGGSGSGLIVCTALAGGPRWAFAVGLLAVGLGLLSVWFEIGRPLRALNVFLHPQRSWMTREAIAAQALVASALLAGLGVPLFAPVAALAAAVFLYCQCRMLGAARGIPAWREPVLLPLMLATAGAEGAGLWMLITLPAGAAPAAVWAWSGALLIARFWLWRIWRARVRSVPRAMQAIDAAGHAFKGGTLFALALVLAVALAPLTPAFVLALQALAGAAALVGGLWFKHQLITRCGFNQGFALPHVPVRGVRRA